MFSIICFFKSWHFQCISLTSKVNFFPTTMKTSIKNKKKERVLLPYVNEESFESKKVKLSTLFLFLHAIIPY